MVLREESSMAELTTSTWSSRSSSTVPGDYNFNPNPAVKDGHDLQWRAVTSAWTSAGSPVAVAVDDLRVESTP